MGIESQTFATISNEFIDKLTDKYIGAVCKQQYVFCGWQTL